MNHNSDPRSLSDQLAAVENKVSKLQQKVATFMDQVQAFIAAFNTALTDIANDLTKISANIAANPGTISTADAAALAAATTSRRA